MGGSGYYNALYEYHIIYIVDVLLSCIYKYHHVFRVGRTVQCLLIISALEGQEHVLLVIVIAPHVGNMCMLTICMCRCMTLSPISKCKLQNLSPYSTATLGVSIDLPCNHKVSCLISLIIISLLCLQINNCKILPLI